MAAHSAAFRDCLLRMDVKKAMAIWAEAAPHLPAPSDHQEAERIMHMARERADSIPDRLKAYSRAWLSEHFPTHVAAAVLTAVGTQDVVRTNRAKEIEKAMSDAVAACFQEGMNLDTDAAEVRRRMNEARAKITGRVYQSASPHD